MKNKLIGKGRTAEIFKLDESKILKLFKKGIPEKVVNLEYKINRCMEKKEFQFQNLLRL